MRRKGVTEAALKLERASVASDEDGRSLPRAMLCAARRRRRRPRAHRPSHLFPVFSRFFPACRLESLDAMQCFWSQMSRFRALHQQRRGVGRADVAARGRMRGFRFAHENPLAGPAVLLRTVSCPGIITVAIPARLVRAVTNVWRRACLASTKLAGEVSLDLA